MPRSIAELIEAQANGEVLSAEDTARLDERERKHNRVIVEMLAAGFLPGNVDQVRAWFLRDLDTATPDELRQRIHWLLGLLEFHEDFFARTEGRFLRTERDQHGGRNKAARSKRRVKRALQTAIDRLKARNPDLTTRSAMALHLRTTDPDFIDKPQVEQKRQIESMTRRLRGRRKNTKKVRTI
jgi:hypothetical protein